MPIAQGASSPDVHAEAPGGAQGPSDEELAAQATAGRLAAFELLMARYQDRVFNMLTRMCGSEEDAEDLTQETFLKAFRALNTFRQGSRFYTWLYRIALNSGFSRRRDDRRRKQREGGSLEAGGDEDGQGLREQVAAPEGDDPETRAERAAIQARVREGLAQIDSDYRAVLVLRDIEGLDYEAIAEALDLTYPAVKSRLHRARKELARILKDLDPQRETG